MLLKWLEHRLTYKPDSQNYGDIGEFGVEPFFIPGKQGNIDVFYCPGERGLVLTCHGNKGNLTHPYGHYKFLKAQGFGFVGFDYPGYGRSEGMPTEQSLYESGVSVFDYLEKNLPEIRGQISLWGMSLGAAVAIEIARQRTVRRVLLECAFSCGHDMGRRRLKGFPLYKLVPNRFNNLKKIKDISAPILLMHGDLDQTTPPTMSHQLFERIKGEKEIVIISGAGHVDVLTVGGEELRSKIINFLN